MAKIILLFLAVLAKSIAASLPCATLRSTVSTYQDEAFIVEDGSAFGNMGEEFLTAEQPWNVPGIWTVSPSCELESCSDVSFNGKCTTIPGGTQSSSDIWLSARCKCNKECTCSNVFMKSSICARAYLQPGGCNTCNARYTELSPDPDELFPDEWKSNVSSILVRQGCTLTVYAEEDLEGDSEAISDHSLKNWSGQFGSFECECDSHIPPVPNQPNTGAIDVPDTMDGVVAKLAQNNFNHNGLLAALSSLTHGRSSKNVYLLMIGSSGAGKSSAINNLLGSNTTTEGDHASTTSDILEFRVPLPVPELHIGNSELRIIDTPGLGDTRGLEYDALFLATLDEYLDNHEDLKSKIPNLVLILHNFNDNRFDGEGAQFVRMIRALDALRPRITDENYSNVLFVFSHLCAAGDKTLQQNPSPRLLMFKDVVEMYSFFPKPLQTIAIENKGKNNYLMMRNDNFELPNGELFPQNLFQKFDTITDKCKDKMGNAVFENLKTLRSQGNPNITQFTYPLVIPSHPKVAKYMSTLSSTSFSINSTEISNLLAQAQGTMHSSMATRFPNCLKKLQRYLNLNNIKSISDVPRTSTAILELLSGIEQNEATSYLLETALNLKTPEFPVDQIAGKSFDIFKNSLLPVSPFNMDHRYVSSIGFRLPTIIRCTKSAPVSTKPLNTFKTFNSKIQYFQELSSSLLGNKLSTIANSTELYSVLTSTIKDGYFVRQVGCQETSNAICFTVTRLYKRFQLDLETSPNTDVSKLTPDFLSRVRSLGWFNQSNYQSVEEWANFFNDFGTHVVKSADGGGRIDIQLTLSSGASPEIVVETVFKILDFVDDPLGSLEMYREDPRGLFTNFGNVINYKLTFRGGNQAYHFSDVSRMTLEQGYNLMKKWKHSLQFYPSVFPKEIVPIGEVIGNYLPDNERAERVGKIELALGRLLSSTLKYVEPTPDPKILEELERQRRENEERLKQMELEAERKRQEAERLRLAEIEAQQRREREARELEERRRREAEAAERKRRQEEEERQRRLMEEEERRRKEQIEAQIRHQQYLQRLQEEQARREEELRRELERQQQEEEERRNRHWKRRLKKVWRRLWD